MLRYRCPDTGAEDRSPDTGARIQVPEYRCSDTGTQNRCPSKVPQYRCRVQVPGYRCPAGDDSNFGLCHRDVDVLSWARRAGPGLQGLPAHLCEVRPQAPGWRHLLAHSSLQSERPQKYVKALEEQDQGTGSPKGPRPSAGAPACLQEAFLRKLVGSVMSES